MTTHTDPTSPGSSEPEFPTATSKGATVTRMTRLSGIVDRHLNASACLILIAAQGETIGRRFILADEPLSIGRDGASSIVIASDAVSRRHAVIFPRGAEYAVVDQGSTNGTYVNDARATDQVLRDGDIVKIGHSVFRFLASGNLEAQYHEEIHKLATTDGLTGIGNRRALEEFLAGEVKRFQRFQRPLSLIFIDIDHFKRVNDTYGHLAGDAVLKGLASTVIPLVRTGVECFARYGGEEFALGLPETTRDGAMVYAEKIRQATANARFTYDDAVIPITISLGVAEMNGGYQTPAQFVKAADTMLYRAKNEGRNRVIG